MIDWLIWKAISRLISNESKCLMPNLNGPTQSKGLLHFVFTTNNKPAYREHLHQSHRLALKI